MKQRLAFVFLAMLVLAPRAEASSIVENLPEYNGVPSAGPFPLASVLVGTFNFVIPVGETIDAVVVSGAFGNSLSATSAGVDLFLDGVLVAQCIKNAACWSAVGPHPWSFNFAPAQFGLFADGVAELRAVQTAETIIRLDDSTLTIRTSAAVPEPTTLFLLGSGISALAVRRRRRTRA